MNVIEVLFFSHNASERDPAICKTNEEINHVVYPRSVRLRYNIYMIYLYLGIKSMDIAAGFCALYRLDGVQKVYDIFMNIRVNLVRKKKWKI